VTTYVWNDDDTLASLTDNATNETLYGYDGLRRLTDVTRADGSILSFTHDDADRTLTTVDGRANTGSLSWDLNGNLVSVTDNANETTSFAYDLMDRIITVTDPGGQARGLSYDELGRVAAYTEHNGASWTHAFDARGRLTSATDGEGKVWGRTWDAESRPVTLTTPLSETQALVTDVLGRVTEATSAAGRVSSFTYDSLGRLLSSAPVDGVTRAWTYDDSGRTASVAAGSLTTALTRDDNGRVTTKTDPLGNDWSRAFDAQGRLASRTDPLGNQVDYAYDVMSRLETATFPAGLGTMSNSYDEDGNLTERAFDGGPTISNTYDVNSRLLTSNGLSLSYDENGDVTESNGLTIARDSFGRVASVTYATDKAVTYAYDGRGLVTSATDWVGGTTTFTYDDAGRLATVSRPNAVTTSYARDADGLVTTIGEGSLASTTLVRDGAGRVTSATRNQPTVTVAAPADVAFTYDVASQVDAFTYDALGRLTSDGADSYTWDLASRLTQANAGGTAVDYSYDGNGYLATRTEGGTTRDYVWNYALGLPSIAVEREAAVDQRYYVHAPNGQLLYAINADDTRLFFHFDEVGNTTMLTDDAGTAVATYAYGPYGEPLGEAGSVENAFRWQGQSGVMHDATSGLFYVRARWFDPSTASFLSRDAVRPSEPREVNPYTYARRDPLQWVDVTGASPIGHPLFPDDEIWLVDNHITGGEPVRQLLRQGEIHEGIDNTMRKAWRGYRKSADDWRWQRGVLDSLAPEGTDPRVRELRETIIDASALGSILLDSGPAPQALPPDAPQNYDPAEHSGEGGGACECPDCLYFYELNRPYEPAHPPPEVNEFGDGILPLDPGDDPPDSVVPELAPIVVLA
jgi:RHS repeat-associated protein